MLDQLKATDFSAHLNQIFQLQLEDSESLQLELIDVSLLGSEDPDPEDPERRRGFSLMFRGPQSPLLIQQIYGLEHEAMGHLDLFLVPLAPDREGARYEAVFT